MTATLAIYRLLTEAAGPALAWHLRRRAVRGREDARRLAERRGIPGLPRPAGPLVWMHAASIGEALSVLPLAERLRSRRPDTAVLLTTGTVGSARLLARRPAGAPLHQFVPLDRAAWVGRFLDHWRPDLALWVESELWPNLVGETARRGIPMALVNGRMSERAFRRWRRLPETARALLAPFRLCLAQSEAHAMRFAALGAARVDCVGNLKLAASPLAVDPGALAALRAAIGNRPVWLAASTHAGEEEMIGAAHRELRRRLARPLAIVAPRDPGRGADVAAALSGLGHAVCRRAPGELPAAATDIYVADTLGELGLLYRVAPLAFIGGSLVPHGGHNPLEPAALGCAILHGPHMANFADLVAALAAVGGAARVPSAAVLAATVERLLRDEAERAKTAAAAAAFASAGRDVLDRVWRALAPLLPHGDVTAVRHAVA